MYSHPPCGLPKSTRSPSARSMRRAAPAAMRWQPHACTSPRPMPHRRQLPQRTRGHRPFREAMCDGNAPVRQRQHQHFEQSMSDEHDAEREPQQESRVGPVDRSRAMRAGRRIDGPPVARGMSSRGIEREKGIRFASADLLGQRAQRRELFARHVLESIAVNAVNSTIQPGEEGEPPDGDRGGDHTPIARIAKACAGRAPRAGPVNA